MDTDQSRLTRDERDYATNRARALRVHTGSLAEAFSAERAHAQGNLAKHHIARNWWAYEGPEVAPFVIYTRWQSGRITVADISGQGQRKGRMTPLCRTLEDLGLAVRFESISNAHLARILRRRGYLKAPGSSDLMPDLVWSQNG